MVSVKSVMVVAGTRPEVIKLSPILKRLQEIKLDTFFIWSGQHYDYELCRIFFEQLKVPEPDLNLNIGSGSHAEQTAKAMIEIEKAVNHCHPSIVVAEGDTNTVAATALAVIKNQVPFAHVEAGLRSYDRTMPEEVNRIVADSLSELLFAPTKLAVMNLTHEGIPLRKIHLTGNTIVDVTMEYKDNIKRKGAELMDILNLQPRKYLLVTLHRQSNTDDASRLIDIMKALLSLSKKYKIVFPAHPRTESKLQKMGLLGIFERNKNLILIGPQGYFEFLGLLCNCLVVLTDSGGVQEEALTLKIPTVTLRFNTERPETLLYDVNVLAGTKPESICKLTEDQAQKFKEIRNSLRTKQNPFGDGSAGRSIIAAINTAISDGINVEASDATNHSYSLYVLRDGQDLKSLGKTFEIIAVYDNAGYPKIMTTPNDAIATSDKILVKTSKLAERFFKR